MDKKIEKLMIGWFKEQVELMETDGLILNSNEVHSAKIFIYKAIEVYGEAILDVLLKYNFNMYTRMLLNECLYHDLSIDDFKLLCEVKPPSKELLDAHITMSDPNNNLAFIQLIAKPKIKPVFKVRIIPKTRISLTGDSLEGSIFALDHDFKQHIKVFYDKNPGKYGSALLVEVYENESNKLIEMLTMKEFLVFATILFDTNPNNDISKLTHNYRALYELSKVKGFDSVFGMLDVLWDNMNGMVSEQKLDKNYTSNDIKQVFENKCMQKPSVAKQNNLKELINIHPCVVIENTLYYFNEPYDETSLSFLSRHEIDSYIEDFLDPPIIEDNPDVKFVKKYS